MVQNIPNDETPNLSDEGDASEARCGNGLEKIYPKTVIRYGYMRYVGEFSYPAGMQFSCGAKVVAQTHRGIELGEQMSISCDGCSKSLSREKIQDYVKASDAADFHFQGGRILREASRDDLLEHEHIRRGAIDKLLFCNRSSRKRKLDMKLVECEHLFGGERVVFYFMAEKRIDFRDLVREMGQEFQTRIEMRQIGARDQARLLADFETCGRECCCKVFLKTLKPVSMKMAKLQKATLDPSKVSGRCGRLKCCLRYEHQTYEELDRLLPRIGKRIHTAHGDGVVVQRQILTQLVQIETEDRKRITVTIEDVGRDAPPPPPRPESPERQAGPSRPEVRSSSRSQSPRTQKSSAGPTARPPNQAGPSKPQEKPSAGESSSESTPTPRRRSGRRRSRRNRGRSQTDPKGENSGGQGGRSEPGSPGPSSA